MAGPTDMTLLGASWPFESLSTTIAIFAGFSIPTYLVASSIYYAYIHPLSKVPGPKLYAISIFPYLYHVYRGDWHETLRQFHNQYGPVVRFTKEDVSFISSDALNKIYGHKSGKDQTFEKDIIRFYNPTEHPNIISGDNEAHKRMRRLLSHAFSEKALRNQENVLNHYVDLFITKLKAKAQEGEVIDIVQWYNFATFDLIGDLAFGESFGCLDKGSYHPWVKMIFESVKVLPFRQIIKRLKLTALVPILTPPSLKRSAKEHHQLSHDTAVKRLDSGNTSREDFMSYILRHNDSEKGMTVGEIVENSSILIIAGSETTATLLSGATYYLLTHPQVYNRVVQEIRSTFQSEEDITMLQVNQLQYMIAVLTEAFRMYPPVPTHLPRVSPAGGEFVDGYWIPEGTSVSIPQWSAYRSEINFRDPDVFDPERWLGDIRYNSDNKAVLQPFSAGPRNCIGKNLAYSEMRMILARLLWNFDLKMMPGSENWNDQDVFVLWEKGNLDVKLTRVSRD
ncbi:related to isotrichodermin C-15 hydroxylase (cytochrome P-450 monooxygenase CYP65A1) [Cephalotrichum gorgonifer]|uniref:Related to isotrichodermin C-15 hydroxylase (Cytochrome P-450 monooxygenase CYP65A1) n=1 Tax=Cephalotrichum gorgonifer TaxID=2041049 RepID=A0AAE8SYZ7_9PEZI|nr:related to isotrichodermin C-15 hydroxylase (cytochrome P-450 monooxygenase CYP65A1) [Cephalotrichum gorgonifer]